MKNALKLTVLLSSLFFTNICFGYEVDTHAQLSEVAVKASDLNTRLQDIGLADIDAMLPDSVTLLCINLPISQQRSILDLIRKGSICEDATFGTTAARYQHHFYNPLNDQGLSYVNLITGGQGSGMPSPVWGLETTDIPGQDFSYKDARTYFYQGLTATAKNEREKNLALTFRTMGDIIHLVQDMGQPQHTRNDSHGGLIIFGPHSLYEIYTDENHARLPFSGYPSVEFATPDQFWHTSDGKGLADYSNRGFVTAGTNFKGSSNNILPNPKFPQPNGMNATVIKNQITDLLGFNQPLSGEIDFISTPVEDKYIGGSSPLTEINPRSSTYSIFDSNLQIAGQSPVFTLNRFNFDAAHQFLILRAVGYSAGLINYFFRGKLDFVPDTTDPSKYVIKNLGQEEMSGTFTLYYDDKDDKRHPVPGAEWTNLTIAAGKDSTSVYFTPPTDPAPKADGEYMLVFKGTLGQETNAVVGHWVEDPLVVVGQSGNQAFRQTLIKRGGVWIKGKMEGLGILPGATWSIAYAVSKDGKVVAGQSGNQAFRWTRDGGMVGIGVLPGYGAGSYSTYKSMSADGSVIVGESGSFTTFDEVTKSYRQAFRWTKTGGIEGLGFLPGVADTNIGTYVRYMASSRDDSYTVRLGEWYNSGVSPPIGHIQSEEYFHRLIFTLNRQEATVVQSTGSFSSSAIDVSADGAKAAGFNKIRPKNTLGPWVTTDVIGPVEFGGSVFVSVAYPDDPTIPWSNFRMEKADLMNRTQDGINLFMQDYQTTFTPLVSSDVILNEAFLWGRVLIKLGQLPNATIQNSYPISEATAISSDGSVIVGLYRTEVGSPAREVTEAFRWDGGLHGIGFLPGDNASSAVDVSSDGSAVIGHSWNYGTNTWHGFYWTQQSGLIDIGGDSPVAISSDGSVVIGANAGEAFMWTKLGGLKGLGVLPGATTSNAVAVSSDGSVIVGVSGSEAFIWENGVMMGLGFIPGDTYSRATALTKLK